MNSIHPKLYLLVSSGKQITDEISIPSKSLFKRSSGFDLKSKIASLERDLKTLPTIPSPKLYFLLENKRYPKIPIYLFIRIILGIKFHATTN